MGLSALAAAGLAVALAGLPVIEEIARAVTPVRAVGPLFEQFGVIRLQALPSSGPSSWHRLRAPVGKIWLNGTAVAPNPDGDFELSFANSRNANTIVLPGWPAQPVIILSTPRVYVTGEQIRFGPDRAIEASLWIRNSLENTVNVYVTLEPAAADVKLEADATIPPGLTQTVRLAGRLPGTSGPPWRIVVEKQEEAMEGGYRFLRFANPDSGATVNSSGKP